MTKGKTPTVGKLYYETYRGRQARTIRVTLHESGYVYFVLVTTAAGIPPGRLKASTPTKIKLSTWAKHYREVAEQNTV